MDSEAANRKETRVGFDGKDSVTMVRGIASIEAVPNEMITGCKDGGQSGWHRGITSPPLKTMRFLRR